MLKSKWLPVTIVIILVLAGICVFTRLPNLTGSIKRAKIKITVAEISDMVYALKKYKEDIGLYPTAQQGMKALIIKPASLPVTTAWKGPYLRVKMQGKNNLLLDPWNNPYQYGYPSKHGKDFDIWSMGPDGKNDTEDDITNWSKPKYPHNDCAFGRGANFILMLMAVGLMFIIALAIISAIRKPKSQELERE